MTKHLSNITHGSQNSSEEKSRENDKTDLLKNAIGKANVVKRAAEGKKHERVKAGSARKNSTKSTSNKTNKSSAKKNKKKETKASSHGSTKKNSKSSSKKNKKKSSTKISKSQKKATLKDNQRKTGVPKESHSFVT